MAGTAAEKSAAAKAKLAARFAGVRVVLTLRFDAFWDELREIAGAQTAAPRVCCLRLELAHVVLLSCAWRLASTRMNPVRRFFVLRLLMILRVFRSSFLMYPPPCHNT